MNSTVAKLGTALLGVLIVCVTILLILGRDPASVMTFAATTVIPTALTLYIGKKVEETKDAAERVVTQTNGRMTELIENNAKLSAQVAALSGAMEPETFSETVGENGLDLIE